MDCGTQGGVLGLWYSGWGIRGGGGELGRNTK